MVKISLRLFNDIKNSPPTSAVAFVKQVAQYVGNESVEEVLTALMPHLPFSVQAVLKILMENGEIEYILSSTKISSLICCLQ